MISFADRIERRSDKRRGVVIDVLDSTDPTSRVVVEWDDGSTDRVQSTEIRKSKNSECERGGHGISP